MKKSGALRDLFRTWPVRITLGRRLWLGTHGRNPKAATAQMGGRDRDVLKRSAAGQHTTFNPAARFIGLPAAAVNTCRACELNELNRRARLAAQDQHDRVAVGSALIALGTLARSPLITLYRPGSLVARRRPECWDSGLAAVERRAPGRWVRGCGTAYRTAGAGTLGVIGAAAYATTPRDKGPSQRYELAA